MPLLSNQILSLIVSKMFQTIEEITFPQFKEALQKHTEGLFWARLFEKITNTLATGYEAYSQSEGEPVFVVENGFFEDAIVQELLTSPNGFTLEAVWALEGRFVDLYGNDQLDAFKENLKVAKQIYEKELSIALPPELKYQFTTLQSQSKQLLEGQKQLNNAVAQIPNMTISALREAGITTATENIPFVALNKEIDSEIQEAKEFIKRIEPSNAIEKLGNLKERVWDQVTDQTRFQILIQTGRAHHLKYEIPKAADLFIRALPFGENTTGAFSFASLGYLLRGEKEKAIQFAKQAIEKDPDNVFPFTYLAFSQAMDLSFEEVLELIPERHRGNPKVAFALGQIAHEKANANAEKWLRIAASDGSENIFQTREHLATFLLEKLLRSGAILFPEGISPPYIEQVKEIINLYDTAFDVIKNSQISHKLYGLLANRGTAKLIAGNLDDAIIDLDLSISNLQPSFEGISKKSRALAALQKGDTTFAIQLLKEVLDNPQTPDAIIWLSIIKYKQRDWNEVVTLTDKYLEEPSDNIDEVTAALRFNISSLIELDKLAQAKDRIQNLLNIKSSSPSAYALLAIVNNRERNEEDTETNISKAIELSKHESDVLELNWVLAVCLDLRRRPEAVAIAEEILKTRQDREILTTYIRTLYAANLLLQAKEQASSFINQFGIEPEIANIYGHILEQIGDRESAQKIYGEWHNAFPLDIKAAALLAQISFKKGDFATTDRLVGKYTDGSSLDFEVRRLFASIIFERGKIEEALEIAYEIRRDNFEKPEAHLLLANMFFRHENNEGGQNHFPEVVEIGTAVRLNFTKNPREFRWVVIEDRKTIDPRFFEYHFSHPLAKSVLEKKRGYRFIFREGFDDVEYEIAEIQTKYLRAFQETVENFNQYFAGVEGLWKYTFSEDSPAEEIFRPVIEQEKAKQKRYEIVLDGYRRRGFTVGTMSVLLGASPIHVMSELRSDMRIGLSSGGQDIWPNETLFNLVQVGMVIDLTSLLLVHELEIQDLIAREIPMLLIAQSTLDEISSHLADVIFAREQGVTNIVLLAGRLTRYEVSADRVRQQKLFFQNTIEWAKDHCTVAPIQLFIEIPVNERDQLTQMLGESFFHSLLIAQERRTLLYSDDRALRNYAKKNKEVDGIWTQRILFWLLASNKIELGEYQRLSARLAAFNIKGTELNIPIIIESARRSNWQPNHEFSATLEILNAYNAKNLRDGAAIAATLIKQIWQEKLLPFTYENLIKHVIKIFLEGRKDRNKSLDTLMNRIDIEFSVAPLEITNLRQLINLLKQHV